MSRESVSSVAAIASLGAVVGYVVFTVVITVAHLATEPWYQSPFFLVGGSAFASVALLAGTFALIRGSAVLRSRHRQFAAIGIVAGSCYLGYLALQVSRR